MASEASKSKLIKEKYLLLFISFGALFPYLNIVFDIMMNGGHGKLTYLCLDWPIEEIQSGEDKSNRLAEKAHIDINEM